MCNLSLKRSDLLVLKWFHLLLLEAQAAQKEYAEDYPSWMFHLGPGVSDHLKLNPSFHDESYYFSGYWCTLHWSCWGSSPMDNVLSLPRCSWSWVLPIILLFSSALSTTKQGFSPIFCQCSTNLLRLLWNTCFASLAHACRVYLHEMGRCLVDNVVTNFAEGKVDASIMTQHQLWVNDFIRIDS